MGRIARKELRYATNIIIEIRRCLCVRMVLCSNARGLWDDVDVSYWQGLRQWLRAALEGPISLASSGVVSTSRGVWLSDKEMCTYAASRKRLIEPYLNPYLGGFVTSWTHANISEFSKSYRCHEFFF
jgi:hypothetical protein